MTIHYIITSHTITLQYSTVHNITCYMLYIKTYYIVHIAHSILHTTCYTTYGTLHYVLRITHYIWHITHDTSHMDTSHMTHYTPFTLHCFTLHTDIHTYREKRREREREREREKERDIQTDGRTDRPPLPRSHCTVASQDIDRGRKSVPGLLLLPNGGGPKTQRWYGGFHQWGFPNGWFLSWKIWV